MIADATINRTAKDPDRSIGRSALELLDRARATRRLYDQILRAAIVEYGDGNGITISGIYRDHYPEGTKNNLRQCLRDLSADTNAACLAWRRSGRRMETLRPFLRDARMLPDGRISYY